MNKETSSRVSSIAARIMSREPTELASVQPVTFNTQLADAKILAGSCMSQDETPGNVTDLTEEVVGLKPAIGTRELTFIDRLKIERIQLSERVEKLEAYLDAGAPGANDDQHFLLKAQLPAMTVYLQILELRLSKLREPKSLQEIADERAVASEQRTLGEAVEFGGHDESRDGPIPFGD